LNFRFDHLVRSFGYCLGAEPKGPANPGQRGKPKNHLLDLCG
jgi:hypothetical protein